MIKWNEFQKIKADKKDINKIDKQYFFFYLWEINWLKIKKIGNKILKINIKNETKRKIKI